MNLWGDTGIICELAQHVIEKSIEENNLFNMDEYGFSHKKNLSRSFHWKAWLMCGQIPPRRIFTWPLFFCVSDADILVLPLFIFPGKRYYKEMLQKNVIMRVPVLPQLWKVLCIILYSLNVLNYFLCLSLIQLCARLCWFIMGIMVITMMIL